MQPLEGWILVEVLDQDSPIHHTMVCKIISSSTGIYSEGRLVAVLKNKGWSLIANAKRRFVRTSDVLCYLPLDSNPKPDTLSP